jgi:hypothetical protein
MPVQMQTRGQAQASPPKLIIDILTDESLFGDGTPLWEREPTADEAKCKRLRLIKRLRRFAAEFPGAAELAARLQACGPHHRCASGACPECARAFQRWLVLQLQRLSHAA